MVQKAENHWLTPESQALFKAILKLKNPVEVQCFFRDLLTEPEIKEFSSRWQAAQMLAKKAPYTQIVAQTGLSSRTVARISRWLNQGMGGYQLIIKRIKK